MLTISATSALGFVVGSNTVVATYGGDANYATSSGSTTVTVNNPGLTIKATNVTISANPGNSGTSTITLTSTGGYAGTAVVSATGSVNVDASFPAGQTGRWLCLPAARGTTTLTITTVSASGNIQKSPASRLSSRRIAAAGGTAAGCLLLLLIPGIRRKRWPVALIMLVFLSVGAGLGCGGGSGGGGGVPERQLHHYCDRGGQQQLKHHCFHHIHSHPRLNNIAVNGPPPEEAALFLGGCVEIVPWIDEASASLWRAR